MTEDDIDFRGRQDRRGGGRLRRRGVRLRRRVRPVHGRRRSSGRARKVLFTSADFPGTIPDHLVATRRARRGAPRATSRSWSTPGTRRSTTSRPTPTRRSTIMAEQAEVTPRSTRSSPTAPRSSRAEEAARRLRGPCRRPDLAARDGPPHQPVPRRVRPGQGGGRPRRPLRPEFTQAYVDAQQARRGRPRRADGPAPARRGPAAAPGTAPRHGDRRRSIRLAPDASAPSGRRPAGVASQHLLAASGARSRRRSRLALGAVGVPRRSSLWMRRGRDDAESFARPDPGRDLERRSRTCGDGGSSGPTLARRRGSRSATRSRGDRHRARPR